MINKLKYPISSFKAKTIHIRYGIPRNYAKNRKLEFFPEARKKDLVLLEHDFQGKPLRLTKETAAAFNSLREKAKKDGIIIMPFSGFRSYAYQEDKLKRSLAKGRELNDILKFLAAPGYSEHHTGRAIDVKSPECKPLEEEFENTDTFKWLKENGPKNKFFMTYPRDNKEGFIYEPWHWCYKPWMESNS